MKYKHQRKRNQQILKEYRAGKKAVTIAGIHHLTRQRVYQLLATVRPEEPKCAHQWKNVRRYIEVGLLRTERVCVMCWKMETL